MIDFEDFASDDFGLTLDTLDLAPNPLPDLPPSWQKPRWWNIGTDDHPGFQTLEDRALHDIERYARPVLDRLGASDDDPVLEHGGEMVSLNDLLAGFALPLC